MTLDYDTILASLKITWNALDSEIKMVAGWTFYDAGMDPVVVVIYDRQRNWTGDGRREDWERVERRMCAVQGGKGLYDTIIDYMKGW